LTEGPAPPDPPRMSTPRPRLEQYIALALLALLAIGCVLVVRPVATAIIVALILATSAWKLHERLVQALGGRRALAAAATTLAFLTVVVAPLAYVGVSLSDDAVRLLAGLRASLADGLPPAPAWLRKVPIVGEALHARWQLDVGDPAHLAEDLKLVGDRVRGALLVGAQLVASGTLQLLVALLIAFFLFRDGAEARARLEAGLARLTGDRAAVLLDVAGGAIRSVVYGIIGTAAAQGIGAALAFSLAGVPAAVLLGFLTFIAAIVPLGAMLVWIPTAAWLASTGATGPAAFIAGFGLTVLLGFDKVLKPYLMSRGVRMPLVLVIVGAIGGAIAFGFLGLFIGPTLLALAYTLVREWTHPTALAGTSAARDAGAPRAA